MKCISVTGELGSMMCWSLACNESKEKGREICDGFQLYVVYTDADNS